MDDKSFAVLTAAPLFAGLSEGILKAYLSCLSPSQRRYKKGDILLHAGDSTPSIGILLSGVVAGYKTTLSGNEYLFSELRPGDLFGDILSGSHAKSPVTLVAVEDTEVLLFTRRRLFAVPCEKELAEAHLRVLQNLDGAMGDKYFLLMQRLDMMLQGTLREQVLYYLRAQQSRAGTDVFVIPFDRAGFAAFLGCDRAALSRVLSQLQKEAVIEAKHNQFRLL